MLSTSAEISLLSKKSKRQTSKSNAQKRKSFPYEIYDYIHTTQYQWLFSLIWYNDKTYALANIGTVKPRPDLNYNGPEYQFETLKFLKKIVFVVLIQKNLLKPNENG